jgi:hypothetical protein
VLDDPARARQAAAVADGRGSQRLSDVGSQAACDAAVASLAADGSWTEESLVRACEAARGALEREAAVRAVPLSTLATTLQVALVENGEVRAAMVGDGAIVVAERGPGREDAPTGGAQDDGSGLLARVGGARILLAPADSEYANEVYPLTSPGWREHLRLAQAPGETVLLFTDGLTRLLLARQGTDWSAYQPFFDSFLPRLGTEGAARLVDRFLQSDTVDRSWDDDKCLVVMTNAR